MCFEGYGVVITGASRGIGEAAAKVFAKAGAKVALLARSETELARIATDIGPSAFPIPCDIADYSKVSQAMETAKDALGQIDVLISNAGKISPMAPLAQTNPSDWADTIDVNLKGVYYGVRCVLPEMIERGCGTLITVSSGAAHEPKEPWSAYCASKAGAYMLTRSIHKEYGDKGIRALGLSPGTVATQMQREIKASGLGSISKLDWDEHIPPEWPAKALLWMCSSDADAWLGDDVSLREVDVRKRVGLQ